jgi:hypothetical protein
MKLEGGNFSSFPNIYEESVTANKFYSMTLMFLTIAGLAADIANMAKKSHPKVAFL